MNLFDQSATSIFKSFKSWENILLFVLLILAMNYVVRFTNSLLFKKAESFFKRRLEILHVINTAVSLLHLFAIGYCFVKIFNPPIEIFLTFGVSLSIALSLALRNMLLSFFSSLAILIDRPYNVGDRVLYKNWNGDIFRIGLRSTKYLTSVDSIVTIPHTWHLQHPWLTKAYNRKIIQVREYFYLAVHADLELAKHIIEKVISTNTYTYRKKAHTISYREVCKHNVLYVQCTARFWCIDYGMEFFHRSEIVEKVLVEFRNNNIARPRNYYTTIDSQINKKSSIM